MITSSPNGWQGITKGYFSTILHQLTKDTQRFIQHSFVYPNIFRNFAKK